MLRLEVILHINRAAIEEDYAKKLAKLSKQHLGRDELGLTKQALDRTRLETANMADAHEKLAAMIRVSLEAKTRDFEAARENKKRNVRLSLDFVRPFPFLTRNMFAQPQALIEKAYKNKSSQEQAVVKARDKYKTDCVSVNGYTAQTSLVQGRELDKAQAKLDKAQATIAVNEREYKLYVNALKETTSKWQIDWKAFCDLAQDIEEERLNYLRISLWEYANGISFICVTDDEFCENIRKHLETCDAPSDLALFVQQHGTSASMHDPPAFIDYAAGDHGTNARPPTVRQANFARSSARQEIIHTGQSLQDLTNAIKPMSNISNYPATASGAVTPVSEYNSGSARNLPASRRGSQADVREREQSRERPRRGSTVSRQQSYGENLSSLSAEPASIASQSILSAEPVRRAQSPARPANTVQASQSASLNRQPSQRELARENYRKSIQSQSGNSVSSPTSPYNASDTIRGRPNNQPNSAGPKQPSVEDSLEAALAALRNPATASEAAENLPHAKERPASTYGNPTGGMGRTKSQHSNSNSVDAQSPYVKQTPYGAPQFQQPNAAAIAAQRRQSTHSPAPVTNNNNNALARSRPASPAPLTAQVQQQSYQSYQPQQQQPGSQQNQYRASSPAPAATMMQAPVTPSNNMYSSVVDGYGQALPGERAGRSRANSVASARSTHRSQMQQPQAQVPANPQSYYAQAQQQPSSNQPANANSYNTIARPLSSASNMYSQTQQQASSARPVSPRPQYSQAQSQQPHQQAYATQNYGSYNQPSQPNQQQSYNQFAVSQTAAQYGTQQPRPTSTYSQRSLALNDAGRQSSPAPSQNYRSNIANNSQQQQAAYGSLTPAQSYAAQIAQGGGSNSPAGIYRSPSAQGQNFNYSTPHYNTNNYSTNNIGQYNTQPAQHMPAPSAQPARIPESRAPTGHFAQGRPVLFFGRCSSVCALFSVRVSINVLPCIPTLSPRHVRLFSQCSRRILLPGR